MESKVKVFGHSVHQTLVAFPVGLLATSVVFDVIAFMGGYAGLGVAGYWMLSAGLVAGIVAAPFGLIDLVALPSRSRAARIGVWHGAGNGLVIALFVVAWVLRRGGEGHAPTAGSLLFSLTAGALTVVTAWMGGELVSRLGVGVADGANVNAPNSLKLPPRSSAHASSSARPPL